ncbi:MAG: hypothetical protein OXH48_07885 [Chloroflexi bacterium]|nr:hypothetical protein [Chloroflexota bacterium]
MKRIFLFAFVLALLLPALAAQAQTMPANEGRGSYFVPSHHGSFSCKLRGNTDDDSKFDIVISYQENSRGEIIQADIYRWQVDWYLNAYWSWHAYGINIGVGQWSKWYRRRCYASARY